MRSAWLVCVVVFLMARWSILIGADVSLKNAVFCTVMIFYQSAPSYGISCFQLLFVGFQWTSPRSHVCSPALHPMLLSVTGVIGNLYTEGLKADLWLVGQNISSPLIGQCLTSGPVNPRCNWIICWRRCFQSSLSLSQLSKVDNQDCVWYFIWSKPNYRFPLVAA